MKQTKKKLQFDGYQDLSFFLKTCKKIIKIAEDYIDKNAYRPEEYYEQKLKEISFKTSLTNEEFIIIVVSMKGGINEEILPFLHEKDLHELSKIIKVICNKIIGERVKN